MWWAECTAEPTLGGAQELILFSRADLERSIPSMVDGFKPGQRKIMFSCFKRNLKKDIKARIAAQCRCTVQQLVLFMSIEYIRRQMARALHTGGP